MKFTEFKFKPFIYEALNDLGFKQTTKIQSLALPKILKGENIVVESATGSGKTHAFMLPLFENINPNINEVQKVILAPTRELAMQLFEVANQIANYCPQIEVKLAIGGGNRMAEIKRLEISQPHIVIGTLGRITDLAIKSNALKIYTANTIVIDEADMVFDQKELVDIDKVMSLFTKQPQFLVFSATVPKALRIFINRYLSGINEIILSEKNLTKSSIEHLMLPCKGLKKVDVLLALTKVINPYLAIVFVNKKENIDEVANLLAEHGLRVAKIHGDLDIRTRKQILKRIHDLDFQYIVASDIASRGIDIVGISHVINYDLPKDIEFYIHRTGRTARHNALGKAISLYEYETEQYVDNLRQKGLTPSFVKIVDGELVQTKLREKKQGTNDLMQQSVHNKYRLPEKVKPGYRKKRLEKITKEIRKNKRTRIEEIYRKKNRSQ